MTWRILRESAGGWNKHRSSSAERNFEDEKKKLAMFENVSEMFSFILKKGRDQAKWSARMNVGMPTWTKKAGEPDEVGAANCRRGKDSIAK